jgi:hypothetical protein
MDEYTVDQVFAWYERLEGEVLKFSEGVPLTIENETLKAPRLISCLMDACGLLDSVFRDRIGDDAAMVNGSRIAKKDCNITHFWYLHSPALDLPNTRSLMLVSPPRYRCPFAKWKNLNEEYIPLPWWQTYNSLKHDVVTNMQEGTLGHVLDSLCALHQVLARSTSLMPILIRRGWFYRGPYTVDHFLKYGERGLITNQKFILMTKLFAVPDGYATTGSHPSQFPEKVDDLLPRDYICSRRLSEFLGRW